MCGACDTFVYALVVSAEDLYEGYFAKMRELSRNKLPLVDPCNTLAHNLRQLCVLIQKQEEYIEVLRIIRSCRH